MFMGYDYNQWINLGCYVIGVSLLFIVIGVMSYIIVNYSEQQKRNKLNKYRNYKKKSAFIDVA